MMGIWKNNLPIIYDWNPNSSTTKIQQFLAVIINCSTASSWEAYNSRDQLCLM